MQTRPPILSRRFLMATAVLALLIAAAGCQSVSHLREAQNAFNAAATTDNRIRLAPVLGNPDTQAQVSVQLSAPMDTLAAASEVRSGYAVALQSLKQIDSQERAQLEKNKLWGAALSLRALAEWKLGLYDDALRSADQAAQLKEQLFPRDAAIVAALPGLIKIDLAYATIAAMTPGAGGNRDLLATVQRRLVGVPSDPRDDSAVNDLRHARQKAGPQHPVTIYLIECQLAAFRNYQIAYQKTHGRSPANDEPAATEAGRNLHDLAEFLKAERASDLATARVNFWQNNYSIVPTPRT